MWTHIFLELYASIYFIFIFFIHLFRRILTLIPSYLSFLFLFFLKWEFLKSLSIPTSFHDSFCSWMRCIFFLLISGIRVLYYWILIFNLKSLGNTYHLSFTLKSFTFLILVLLSILEEKFFLYVLYIYYTLELT